MLLSVFLATGPQYVFGAIFFLWFLHKRVWKSLKGDYYQAFKTTLVGLLGAVVFTWLSAFASWAYLGDVSLWEVMAQSYHLTAKWAIRGVVILAGFIYLAHHRFRVESLAKPLFVILFCHFLYLLAQKYTGINIVHGLTEILPPNRFNHGSYRVSGLTGHPLTLGYGAFLMAMVGFLNGTWPPRGQKKNRLFWGGIFLFSFSTLLLTQSRWPLFVLFLLLLVRGFFYLKSSSSLRKKRAIYILLIFSLLLGAIFTGLSARFSEIWKNEGDLVERMPRIAFWQVHWAMFQDNPLLGVGYVKRNSEKLDYYKRSGYNNISRKYSAHNIYLQTAADSGILGLLGLLSLLFSGWLIAARAYRRGDPRLLYFMSGVTLAGLMQNTFRDSEFVFSYWVCFALILTGCPAWKQNQKSQTEKELFAL